MKLKVCGMRSPDNIASLSALAPDYMGFIFWEHSKRFVSDVTPKLPHYINKTGVFVDASARINHLSNHLKKNKKDFNTCSNNSSMGGD